MSLLIRNARVLTLAQGSMPRRAELSERGVLPKAGVPRLMTRWRMGRGCADTTR
jgi:hypothetical protein